MKSLRSEPLYTPGICVCICKCGVTFSPNTRSSSYSTICAGSRNLCAQTVGGWRSAAVTPSQARQRSQHEHWRTLGTLRVGSGQRPGQCRHRVALRVARGSRSADTVAQRMRSRRRAARYWRAGRGALPPPLAPRPVPPTAPRPAPHSCPARHALASSWE